jgi:Kef-type K+ transport system membrane component KefB
MLARIRGIVLAIVLILAVLAIAFGIVYGIAQPLGGLSVDVSIFYGLVLVLVAFGVLAYLGRRRQKRAQAQRAQQVAGR